MTQNLVKKISSLVAINIEESEEEFFLNELNDMFGMIEKLKTFEISKDILPMTTIHPDEELVYNEDIAQIENSVDDLFENSPKSYLNFYTVPKVIE